jgi:hypothetical protein
MRFNRNVEIERAEVGEDASFPITLFTDGEASDGHVLNIAGARTAPRMPLFVNHWADPTMTMGSLTDPKRSEHAIRYRAQIDLGAPESSMAAIRRDVAYMIGQGHVRAVSGRWDADPKDIVPRTALSADHPAYVDPSKEPAGRKRWGLYFKRWTALEGSIVGLGADPKALIGRSEDASLPEPVRAFWRAEAQAQPQSELELLYGELRLRYQAMRAAGASFADVLNALQGVLGAEEAGTLERLEREGLPGIWLPAPLRERLEGERAALSDACAAIAAALSATREGDDQADADPADEPPEDSDPAPPERTALEAPSPAARAGSVAAISAAEFFERLESKLKSSNSAIAADVVRRVTGRVSA